MRKQILFSATLFLISFTSAYYPGEIITITNEMGIDNLVYTITGNSSPVSELQIDINTTNISIFLPGDLTPDTFNIIFIENITNEVVKTIHVGGGGGTRYIDRNITVTQPEIYYRNISEGEVVEKIIEISKGYSVWDVFLAALLGALLTAILIKIMFISMKREVKKNEQEIYG